MKQWRFDGEEQQCLERLFREGKVNSLMEPKDVQEHHPIFHGFSLAEFRFHWDTLARDPDQSSRDKTETVESPTRVSLDPEETRDTMATSNFKIHNYPIVPGTYHDPITHQDMVFVKYMLLSNEDAFTFDIIDGRTLLIEYAWPEVMCNVDELLKTELDNDLPKDHPKYLALKEAIEKAHKTGQIRLTLPQEVKRDPSCWKKEIYKFGDGSTMALLKFECV